MHSYLTCNFLRGEIVGQSLSLFRGVRPRGKIREQGSPLITSHKELPSFFYSITIIQVVNKRSYKGKWGK
jgi:hypothetical protein